MSYLETIGEYLPSWVSSQLSETHQAKLGLPIGMQVYDSLDPTYVSTPSGISDVLSQVIYLVSIGIRRADYDGNSTAKLQMQTYLDQLEKAQSNVNLSLVCQVTGYGCPTSGSIALLGEAIKYVDDSNLSTFDKTHINEILKRSKNAMMLRNVVKYGLAGTLVLGVSYLGFRFVRNRP